MVAKIKKKQYEPNEKEKFMNHKQLNYFKNKLEVWKNDLLKESNLTLENLKGESLNKPDIADRASLESEKTLELRTRDRARKLISKINKALKKIDEGTYGYCEESGEPIGLKRLMARPVATLSIEAQEKHERDEKIFVDD